jgi:hypothetical protein
MWLAVIALVCLWFVLRPGDSIDSVREGASSDIATKKFRADETQSTSSARTSRPDSRARDASALSPDKAREEVTRLIADDQVPMRDAAKGLLAIAGDPRISTEVRLEALQHGLTLVEDDAYAELVLPSIQAQRLELPEMHRVLLDSAYNSEPVAKIPAVFALYQITEGDIKNEARELLGFITESDAVEIGDDLQRWEKAVQKQLEAK